MKTILITGCAGFIGSNFVNKTLNTKEVLDKYKFVILDALTYAANYDYIKKAVEENKSFEFVEGNICDLSTLSDLFEQHNFKGVINFAAESHVDNSISNPNIFVETNVIGTQNLLNLSRDKNEKDQDFRYLQISTDEVYGSLKKDDAPFSELHQITPNSPYSASKASADLLVHSYFKTFNLPTIITRCSNNYGPNQHAEKLIPTMINRAIKNEKLPVYGDGSNIRDWIHVDDHNRGIWLAFTKGRPGQVYNFGGNTELSNLVIVKKILSILKKPESLISFVQDRKGHDWRYAINFEKAKRELGFSPTVDFTNGLKETVEWFRCRKN